jgi:hypothetical protein
LLTMWCIMMVLVHIGLLIRLSVDFVFPSFSQPRL